MKQKLLYINMCHAILSIISFINALFTPESRNAVISIDKLHEFISPYYLVSLLN